MKSRRALLLSACCLFIAGHSQAAVLSPLLARGYTVIPEPQQVSLRPADFQFGAGWKLELGSGVEPASVAVQSLREDLESRFHVSLGPGAAGVVRLEIAPGSVVPGHSQDQDRESIQAQAYRIELAPARIRIAANAPAGLFYGVETLIQLVKRQGGGALSLPEGEIADWPDLRERHLYWDDAHHVERLAELKRAVRQAARFKINGFVIKLEGHFQYHSAAALVEPYALSPAELQELTDYGLRYYVQVIPYLDAPAHIGFILKHPEYAKLRAFPDSNYELCTTNPESYKLLFGMYDDLLAANKGVRYFYLSTDEPYYVGMADNACQEKSRARELGSVGKVLAEFVTKAAGYLHERGRTVVFWGEYPLKPGDIQSLPQYVVNGETYGREFDPVFKARGIRQMIYTSTEGVEDLFPQYFVRPASERLHPQGEPSARVPSEVATIVSNTAREDSELMGVMVAGWADSGLHPETFWLGYAAITAAGWHPGSPDPHESMSAFYPAFYGPAVQNMDRVYQLMSYQAQLWTDTWDTVDSKSRKPIWGNSEGIFHPGHPAEDQAIPLPPVPSAADLNYSPAWLRENARRLRIAEGGLAENDALVGLLNTNLRLAESNRYSLEVFLSIAHLCRQNLDMLSALGRIDASLASAQEAAKKQEHSQAVEALDRALAMAREIRARRNAVLRDTIATWQKSWEPRVSEANGRRFLHELDDVKDHLPDRTVDMSYLVYRELLLPLGDWYKQVESVRNQYAAAHGAPARQEPLAWEDLK